VTSTGVSGSHKNNDKYASSFLGFKSSRISEEDSEEFRRGSGKVTESVEALRRELG
jgi:hypothetical protein